MVDAAIVTSSRANGAGAEAATAVSAELIADQAGVENAIDAIGEDMIFTGYQHPDYLRAWTRLIGCQPMFIRMNAPGHGPVLLPLELCKNGIAGYCGGRHANGNFPVGHAEDIAALARIGRDPIAATLRRLKCPAAAIFLERQHGEWSGVANPFVFDDSVASPNLALSFEIESDFETVLKTHGGKSKRKKVRSYRRKLEAEGEVRLHQPVNAGEERAYLDAFFQLKAERFRQAGIVNVFGDAATQEFFKTLFSGNPTFQLHALTVDDVIAAVIGCTIHRGRLTVEFGSFDQRFTSGRPGEVLFYDTVEHACETGLQVFDFGIGDEPYKRAWCDIETVHQDSFIGLTATGRARALARSQRNHLVRSIKSNETLWRWTKSARKALHSGG